MALKIFEKFSPRANPADVNYPYGSIKNESVPGAKDGTPLDASWGNDMLGFTDALLDEAGITPNGLPDTVGSSQRLEALKELIKNSNITTLNTVSEIPSLSGNVENGQLIKWNCYRNIFDGGDNIGVVKTGPHTADGGSIFSIDANTYIQADLSSGVIPIRKFGAYCDGVNDDTLAIQNAAYALGSLFGQVKKLLIQGTPRISKGILLYARDGCSVEGESGKVGTFIRMDQNMTVELDSDFQALQDQNVFDYTYPAAFVVSAARRLGKADWASVTTNTAQWAITFRNLGFTQDFEIRQAAAIHAPRIGNCKFDNMLFKGVQSGLRSQDIYTTSMDACFFTKVVTPIDHYSTGTFTATGTSFHLTATGVSDCDYGWRFNKLFYSSMTCCACDGWARYQPDGDFAPTSYAYDMNGCSGMVLTSCGAEDTAPDKMKGLFKFTGGVTSSVIVDGGAYVIEDVPSTTNIELCTFDSQSVTLRGPTFLLNTAGGKIPYCGVLSGDVIVESLNQAIEWRRLFNFDNATATARLLGNDPRQICAVEASVPADVPFADDGTVDVSFGVNDLPFANGWAAWNGQRFTAPYSGAFRFEVAINCEGVGLNYFSIKKPVGESALFSYDPTDPGIKQYAASKTLYLNKGEQAYVILRTAPGATGNLKNTEISITQVR